MTIKELLHLKNKNSTEGNKKVSIQTPYVDIALSFPNCDLDNAFRFLFYKESSKFLDFNSLR